ncbi:TonB-dependent receptor plug domain-containing protein [Sphingomonas sp. SUN039]|uniref:TonB-dependent receptor plug domain-containing protein n=1 Tax=Sphingomonas sp. SUN039 TaxID=2937787 RepID=UPI0021647421|nr:TonB-dependent receptor plug domain-containing protein [Sphingomonas sp. SUN039]UVO53495.1 TonB-dependent receptor plug domain-containing protein [Sphingomonas sp. SUN039]
MKNSVRQSAASLGAIAVMMAVSAPAFAQTPAAPAASAEPGLDEIVVTASGRDKSRLQSAVAVTSVDAATIANFKPVSESEIYRLIPGIQAAGTAGPGGNSNIAVRGLPVATGGSPFVQLQEDGLPTVLFGDIQFGNNDYFTRYDASVERLESVRGGGATTYASQAPGAIINYISNTGEKAGGFFGINQGLDFREARVDFRYGAPIGENTRFHIGGFYKVGNGPLNNFRVSNSIQIKANLTQEFGDGKGYVRLLAKFANTKDPNYTGAPALATRNGNTVSNITPFAGFDGRSQNNYSVYNTTGLFLNRAGTALERRDIDGITTKQFSIGAQFHYEFGDNFTVDNNFRWSDISGAFAAPFLNLTRTTGIIGSTVNGGVVASLRYAAGPRAGQVYTGTYVDNNVNVRTNIRDAGSIANDLALSGKFDAGFAKVTARAGLFVMRQNIGMDWHVNQSTREVSGDNPAQLDLYTAAGARLTNEGISGYNNNWGTCCARDYDLSYTNTAPFLSLDLDGEAFALDGSVRFENVKAKGGGTQGGTTITVSSGGVNLPALLSNSVREVVDYSRSYTSWTAGALWKANANTSIFIRASKGGRFNGDRQTFGGKFTTTGALCTSAQARAATNGCTADGVTPSVDFVNQYEIGIKNRGNIGTGRYSVEFSLLKADFKQSTFELSATRCGGAAGGCIIDSKYRSTGAEFFGTLSFGAFSLVANATYSDSQQLDGTTYRRASYLPSLTYTVSTNYDIGDMVTLGLAATGQSSVRDDPGNVYPGGIIVNSTISVRPVEHLEVGLQAYNLFNKLDFRGNGSNVADVTGANSVVLTGTPVVGQTFLGTLKYSF